MLHSNLFLKSFYSSRSASGSRAFSPEADSTFLELPVVPSQMKSLYPVKKLSNRFHGLFKKLGYFAIIIMKVKQDNG
jgi:hypothetical protein